jgi:lysophospholipase L1-like esterase
MCYQPHAVPTPRNRRIENGVQRASGDFGRARRWFARLCLMLFGLALGLVLIETGLHLAAVLHNSEAAGASELRGLHRFRPDLPWLFELRPGAEGRISATGAALYRINADGLRDSVYARPKPDGVFRVVVLGDSVSFGYGVEEAEAYPQVLEELLSELVPDSRVEVVNLGVGGYNAYNEAKLLEGVGQGYEPDLVLVQFCINDLNDPTVHFDKQTRIALSAIPDAAFPDPSQRRGSAHVPSRGLRWCRASKLCATIQDLWLAMAAPEFDDQARRDAVDFIEATDRPEWRWLEARYEEMDWAANAGGASFAILAFPYQKQLAEPSPHPVQVQLATLGQRHGWPVIDPLTAFQDAHTESTPLFMDWWHPTRAGHRVAAVAIARALACGGQLGAEALRACPTLP